MEVPKTFRSLAGYSAVQRGIAMLKSYDGILRGDRIDWMKYRPPSHRSVRVRVTVLEEKTNHDDRKKRMTKALEELAEHGGVQSVPDASEWQCQTRRERTLPGRET